MSRAPIKLKRKPPEWKPFDSDEEKMRRPAKAPRERDEKDLSKPRRLENMYGCGEMQRVLEDVAYFPVEISDLVCRYEYSEFTPVIASSVPFSRSDMPEFKKYPDTDSEYRRNWVNCIAKRASASYKEIAVHKGLRGFSSIRVILSTSVELDEIEFHIGFTFDAAVQFLPFPVRRRWIKSQTPCTLAVVVIDHGMCECLWFFTPFQDFYDDFVKHKGMV
jgi:hypothetical protein